MGNFVAVSTNKNDDRSKFCKYIEKEIDNRIFGTASTIAFGILNGANILRVHDYKEMMDVKKMTQVLKDSAYSL